MSLPNLACTPGLIGFFKAVSLWLSATDCQDRQFQRITPNAGHVQCDSSTASWPPSYHNRHAGGKTTPSAPDYRCLGLFPLVKHFDTMWCSRSLRFEPSEVELRRMKTGSARNEPSPHINSWQRPIFPGPNTQVSSALVGLTTVFGMGTGGTPPVRSPGNQNHIQLSSYRTIKLSNGQTIQQSDYPTIGLSNACLLTSPPTLVLDKPIDACS